MTYRNRDLLDLARLAPCCMSCGKANEGDVVAAHANSQVYGKGAGLKAADWAVAYVCGDCHHAIDQSSKLDEESRAALWLRAHVKTQDWLFSEGHLVVAEEARRPEQPPKLRARVKKSRPIRSNPKIQSRAMRRQEKQS